MLKAGIQLTATVKCAVFTVGPAEYWKCGDSIFNCKFCAYVMQARYMLEVTRMCLCILFSLCQIRKN